MWWWCHSIDGQPGRCRRCGSGGTADPTSVSPPLAHIPTGSPLPWLPPSTACPIPFTPRCVQPPLCLSPVRSVRRTLCCLVTVPPSRVVPLLARWLRLRSNMLLLLLLARTVLFAPRLPCLLTLPLVPIRTYARSRPRLMGWDAAARMDYRYTVLHTPCAVTPLSPSLSPYASPRCLDVCACPVGDISFYTSHCTRRSLYLPTPCARLVPLAI